MQLIYRCCMSKFTNLLINSWVRKMES
uniref:Uncharacterized protein n=1 Tax=Arundo donax TaxID=35708 RepID=A0A0A9BDQ5_ARUDO